MRRIGDNKGPKWDAEIAAVLSYMREHERVTFAGLGRHLGVPVSSQTYVLRRALELLVREGITFQSLPGIGYERLNNDGKAQDLGRAVRKTSRAARRGLRRSAKIDESQLNSGARTLVWARRTVLQSLAKATHGNSINAAVKRSLLEEERKRQQAELSAEATS